jgi:hypothetical protein
MFYECKNKQNKLVHSENISSEHAWQKMVLLILLMP